MCLSLVVEDRAAGSCAQAAWSQTGETFIHIWFLTILLNFKTLDCVIFIIINLGASNQCHWFLVVTFCLQWKHLSKQLMLQKEAERCNTNVRPGQRNDLMNVTSDFFLANRWLGLKEACVHASPLFYDSVFPLLTSLEVDLFYDKRHGRPELSRSGGLRITSVVATRQ